MLIERMIEMKTLWTKMDRLKVSALAKSKLFIAVCTVLGSVAGVLCWTIIRNFALDGIDWMLVFICYPGFILFIIAVGYIYNHEFEEEEFEN